MNSIFPRRQYCQPAELNGRSRPHIQLPMKYKALAALLVALMTVALSTSTHAADAEKSDKGTPIKHVKSDAAAKLLTGDVEIIVIDIRTPKEFQAGHIKWAKNIDFYEDDFGLQIRKLDRSKVYLVHCASGGRSGKSLELFEALKFESVYHLADGYKGWEKAGNPIEK
jgi:phage shock protein E